MHKLVIAALKEFLYFQLVIIGNTLELIESSSRTMQFPLIENVQVTARTIWCLLIAQFVAAYKWSTTCSLASRSDQAIIALGQKKDMTGLQASEGAAPGVSAAPES